MKALRLFWPLVMLLGPVLAPVPGLASAPAQPPHAHTGPQQKTLDRVAFSQNIGRALPPAGQFRNARGETVKLADLNAQRPLILVMAWFDCPHLCPTLLDQLAEATAALPYASDDYRVVLVNIDPHGGAASAAGLERRLARRHGQAISAWHFLAGNATSIEALAQGVGFHYAYDSARDSYAHPAGLVFVAPGGVISSYLLGLDPQLPDLRLALVDAGRGRLGSAVDQLLLRCYHFDPQGGRYTLAVTRLLQVSGSLFVFGLAVYLASLRRRRST